MGWLGCVVELPFLGRRVRSSFRYKPTDANVPSTRGAWIETFLACLLVRLAHWPHAGRRGLNISNFVAVAR
jgi:hypothetical protein